MNNEPGFSLAETPEEIASSVGIRDAGDLQPIKVNDVLLIFSHQGYIYRVARSAWSARKLIVELALLRNLAGKMPCQIPDPVDSGDNPTFAKYRLIEGTRLSRSSFPGNRISKDFLQSLANAMSILHALQVDEPVREALPQIDRSSPLLELFERVSDDIKENAGDGTRKAILAAAKSATKEFSSLQESSSSLLHYDLASSNIIVDGPDQKLRGIIDFTNAAIGDPHNEFITLFRKLRGDELAYLIDVYDSNRRCQTSLDRIAYYDFYWSIIRLHQELKKKTSEKKNHFLKSVEYSSVYFQSR